ncbi:MAG: FHA domain-containing protein, partial [Chloroflexi bacterium]
MSKLTIRTGPQAGIEFSLDRPVVRIGRGSMNEIVIQDNQSSRQHTEITRQGDQLIVRDMGSTNGTFVNGERITGSRTLRPGDQLRIGETTFGFEAGLMGATPAVASGWDSQLMADTGQVRAAGRPKWLVWGLAALVVLLLAGAAAAALLLLRDDDATPTAVAGGPTAEGTVQPIVVAPTATSLPAGQEQPAATDIVQVPTTELLPTVAVQMTPPPAAKPPTAVPAAQQAPPLAAGQLEQLPEAVTQYLGDVPPDQLPEALADQIQSMPQEQVQEMIGALFPGGSPDMGVAVV